MLLWLLHLTITIMVIMVAIAFITLLERCYMGIAQRRRGPNKVSIWGMFQPILDGVKLVFKTTHKSYNLNFFLFSIIPSINLLLFILFWAGMPFIFNLLQFSLSSLFIMVLLGMMGFGIMITGWASNNKYALFGSLRSMTQSISYEIALALVILAMMCMKNSFNLSILWKGFSSTEFLFSMIFMFPVAIMILAECGRTPFDLMEAESELVSGYNIEYSSVEFAFLFMSEYGMVILLSILFSIILASYMASIISLSFISIILFGRYTLPRLRYDYLMSLMWKSLLPATLLLWMCIFNVSVNT
uniref:NADH-ubiquinone oxidoreductase chain 1 n=1 Tax=Trichuris sp. LO613 TaxID=2856030 RepID=A0A8F5DQL4_9BILA|nr:NADH dehydrogenase subunit 1 [Trichuris sp. LO613]